MGQLSILKDKHDYLWLTVHYSPAQKAWLVETTWPGFITGATAKGFEEIEVKGTLYMVRGFDTRSEVEEFATGYHRAKENGANGRTGLG